MVLYMPLTERAEFKTVLQKGNRLQVPKLIRWKHKLESSQVLRVSIAAVNRLGSWETFHARIDKSGRITVSRLMQEQVSGTASRKQSLIGEIVFVRIEPS